MSGHKGNSVSPQHLRVLPEAKGKLRIRSNQNSLFLMGPVSTLHLKVEETAKNKIYLMPPGTQISCSQGVQPDHVQVKISSCSFPRDLVSFDP